MACVHLTNIRQDFCTTFGLYIRSRDPHAIRFKHGVDTKISHESGMVRDPFPITKLT